MSTTAPGAARRLVRCLAGHIRKRAALTRLGAGLLVVVVLAVGLTVWDLRRVVLDDALVSTNNLAIVLAQQTNRSVQAVDIVLRDVQERIAALGVTTPEAFRRVLGTQEMNEFLRSRMDRLPQVDDIALIDAAGMPVNNTVSWPVKPGDLSDRDYTQHFAAQDDPGLFISEPVVSRATNVRTLYLARRVNGPHGEFLGMVLGGVPLREFAELYQPVSLPHGETFLLARRDGTVLVRHPDPVDRAGMKMPAGLPWYAQVAEGGGHYELPGVFDGVARLVAVRLLRDYPLVMMSPYPRIGSWRTGGGKRR